MRCTKKQLILAAASLFEPESPVDCERSDYARGVCELIGRLELDFGKQGEGTAENAQLVAVQINEELLKGTTGTSTRKPRSTKTTLKPVAR